MATSGSGALATEEGTWATTESIESQYYALLWAEARNDQGVLIETCRTGYRGVCANGGSWKRGNGWCFTCSHWIACAAWRRLDRGKQALPE
jgi:hypothetical protein